jgi:cation diffusion facilitator CzcD-associated flavoprotein CzcO
MTQIVDDTEGGAGEAAGPGGDVAHLDVLVIGAGLSGVGAGCYLERESPWARYAIFEARDAIGGTWDLFRYPGIRSDSDMHTLGYSFRPWDGEKSIADGDSILQYIKDTAAAYGVDSKIRFHHRVTAANWSSDDTRWHVTAERTDTGETVHLTAGFLFSCSGYYRYDHGYLPDFAGMDSFEGTIVHPQAWPEGLDVTGRRVVVIGSGATAVTLVPALAPAAAHVTMLQRSPTYIASLPEKSPAAAVLRKVLPAQKAGTATKWFHALMTQGFYHVCRRYPKQMRRLLIRGLQRELPKGYDVATHFTPTYNPWDQRFCAVPNGDLFKALSNGSAEVVTDTIERFTPKGLRLSSGAELEADVIVTATGLELLFLGGMALTVDGESVDPATRLSYKGMMLEGVPNLAVAIGYTNASWTLKCDLTCDYVCRLLNHMHERVLTECVARNTDGTVEEGTMLGLTSGYIQRSAHLLPKQGAKHPWRVHQSYLRDYRALKITPLDDGYMMFRAGSGAAGVGVPSEPAVASLAS